MSHNGLFEHFLPLLFFCLYIVVSDAMGLHMYVSHVFSLFFFLFVLFWFACFLKRQRMKVWGWMGGEVKIFEEMKEGKTMIKLYCIKIFFQFKKD